jgi:hypothetical protein
MAQWGQGEKAVKYFFLSDGWITGRIWEFGGLWNDVSWQRQPHIQRLDLCIQEQGERLWLYQVEDAVLMVEVHPQQASDRPIGQVVLKRLISAEQAIQHLCDAEAVIPTQQLNGSRSTPPTLS